MAYSTQRYPISNNNHKTAAQCKSYTPKIHNFMKLIGTFFLMPQIHFTLHSDLHFLTKLTFFVVVTLAGFFL
jgi:hypothetical protein